MNANTFTLEIETFSSASNSVEASQPFDSSSTKLITIIRNLISVYTSIIDDFSVTTNQTDYFNSAISVSEETGKTALVIADSVRSPISETALLALIDLAELTIKQETVDPIDQMIDQTAGLWADLDNIEEIYEEIHQQWDDEWQKRISSW